MTEWLPARFKTVIHLDREVSNVITNSQVLQSSKLRAYSAPHGEWIARINESSEKGNPMPVFDLPIDPNPYWVRYDELKIGGK